MKHLVQAKIKAAYNSYIQNILGLSKGGDDNIENNQDLFQKVLLSNKKDLSHDRAARLQSFERSATTLEYVYMYKKLMDKYSTVET